MNEKANYHPNCYCHVCGAPMYRTPKYLEAGRLPFCCRDHWRKWNSERDMSHLHSPEVVAKRALSFVGEQNPAWRGGRYVEPGKGYVMVRCPKDFQVMARKNGYVLEHRLVMAQHLGRLLKPTEVVHHINGKIDDNRLENLRLYSSHRKHYIENHAQQIAADNSRTRRTVWKLKQKS